MRPTTLLVCLALAGCGGANTTSGVTGSKRAQAQAAAPAPSALVRAAQARAAGHDDWWKEGGVTREKINAMCWMRYERGRRDMPVEQRADLVDDCVQETLLQHPLR